MDRDMGYVYPIPAQIINRSHETAEGGYYEFERTKLINLKGLYT
jgi:hypothetical protein